MSEKSWLERMLDSRMEKKEKEQKEQKEKETKEKQKIIDEYKKSDAFREDVVDIVQEQLGDMYKKEMSVPANEKTQEQKDKEINTKDKGELTPQPPKVGEIRTKMKPKKEKK